MASSEHYTRTFYQNLSDGAARSADVVAPLVLEFVRVRSVVDVGCGDGSWLAAFQRLGVQEILGLDGDYVDRDLLQIPPEHFMAVDLTKPVDLGRKFDLAISLEVAEHLPAECAPSFVTSLVAAAPVVLFSAAIPHQGGSNHVNEQWPDYWGSLFGEHSYVAMDYIRPRVWKNEAVERWYSQNTLLFARKDVVEQNPALKRQSERTDVDRLSLVHPNQYLYIENLYREALAARPTQPSGVIAASRLLAVCVKNSLRKRLFGKV